MADGRVVVAILKPAPGKADRMKELLVKMTKSVHQKEPGALRYHLHKQIESDEQQFVVIETYKDKAAHETHANTNDFKELFKTFGDEGLLSGQPTIVTCESVAGFADRNEPLRG